MVQVVEEEVLTSQRMEAVVEIVLEVELVVQVLG
jgi:hypothetical protein